MRPLRSLVAAAAAVVLSAGAGTASAAPPVACVELPISSTLLCVVSFTPENAVPDGSSGDREVAVITYDGQTYSVVVRDVPPLPEVPPSGECPDRMDVRHAGPYLCLGTYSDGGLIVVASTCVPGRPCSSGRLPVGPLAQEIADRVEDLRICRPGVC